MVAQSFSKNFGLYGERVGVLHVVCRTEIARSKTLSMLSRLSRAEITTSPINGARIVAKVLGDADLKQQWQRDLLHMSGRMKSMRKRLVDALLKYQTPGSWDHILTDVSNFDLVEVDISYKAADTFGDWNVFDDRLATKSNSSIERDLSHISSAVRKNIRNRLYVSNLFL